MALATLTNSIFSMFNKEKYSNTTIQIHSITVYRYQAWYLETDRQNSAKLYASLDVRDGFVDTTLNRIKNCFITKLL